MIQIGTSKGTAKIWLPIEKVEPSAMQQIYAMIEHPHLYKWVAIMPDVHAGIGATIGSVIPMDGVIIPSAVGVDIGCGMCSVKTNLNIEQIKPYLKDIHDNIITRIPRGFAHRTPSQKPDVHKFASSEILSKIREYSGDPPLFQQLGTLGGGNHFIELQQDDKGIIYIMLHSGSRNIGNKLASQHIKTARQICEGKGLPKDLECLDVENPSGKDYIRDMNFALEFAKENRFIMMEIIKDIINQFIPTKFEETINIHHNYASKEKHFDKDIWVHRKGATHVTKDITGIIPGSMGTSSYLVKGKNNSESFLSCSHGAGRLMSRKKAKELDFDEFSLQMEGIYSESVDNKHLDEAPNAYKDIDEVMQNQTDLVDIVVKLKPVLNIKG